MVDYRMTAGEEERNALLELSVRDPEFQSQQKKTQGLILIIAAFFAVLGIVCGSLIYGIGAAAFAVFALVGVQPLQKAIVRNRFSKMDSRTISGERHYIVGNDGITITSEMGSGHNKWDAFVASGEIGHYYWLRRADRQVILFNKKLLSEEECAELKGYLKKYVAA